MKRDFVFELYKSKKTVFTLRDISLILGDNNLDALKSKAHYYVKKGVLRPVRRGLYVKPEYDALELATKVYTPSYISLETVLQREGVIFQYYDSMFVISYLSRTISIDGKKITFRKIKDSILLNKNGIVQNENYAIATKERAFLDALYLYREYNFGNISALDRQAVNKLLPVYRSKVLAAKAARLLKENG